MSKAAVRFCLFAASLLVLSACSGSNQDQSGSSTTPSDPSVTVNAADPPTENTAAVEKPLPPQAGKPGIRVASLPIGGADNTGGPCVQVSWSGGDIPEGYGVQIDKVSFEGNAYQQSDSQCPGSPCVGQIFRAGRLSCDLAITPTEASARGSIEGDQVRVFMKGRLLCPDYGAADCRAFEKQVRQQGPSMTVPRPPDAPGGSTDSATTDSATTDSSNTDSSNTDSSNTDSSTITETPGG